MKESTFQTALIKGLRKIGAKVYNIHGHGMQEVGIPDLYVLLAGRSCWVELKTGINDCTGAQARQLKDLRLHGVPAFVCSVKESGVMTFEREGGTVFAEIGYVDDNIGDIFLEGWSRYEVSHP